MGGPKATKKKQHQQQQKRGIDFKKIRRKIGKKLPPPNNVTNTRIKSKAIILPEQSVATEKVGSATSKKGLTLEDLLKQTSHHNSKVRRDALIGVRDLILKHPDEPRRHKLALIEKLSQRIGDEDQSVRETLYQLLQSVVLPAWKEDIRGSLLTRMMAYIFNAMTHFSMEVRLMAFKYLDLVVQNDSLGTLISAEKILQSYLDFLASNPFNVQDKGRVKGALPGLVHCLLLLKSHQEDHLRGKFTGVRDFLHGYWLNDHSVSVDLYLVINKLKDLVPVLITRLLELLQSFHSTESIGIQLLDAMLYILQCINLAVKISVTKFQEELKSCHNKSQRDEIRSQPKVVEWYETVSSALVKLLVECPLHSENQILVKKERRYAQLDAEITQIFLKFQEWLHVPEDITNKFLPYIEMLLEEEKSDGNLVHAEIWEKNLLSFFPYIPNLISQHVSVGWRYRLLQAFTRAFMGCHPKSKLKLASISAIKEMLIHGSEAFLDPSDPEVLDIQIRWIRELPHLLVALGDKNPSSTEILLKLINHLGGCAPIHPSFLLEYEDLKTSFQAFFCTSEIEGSICYGPFLRLPQNCQRLSLACLTKFSCIDVSLLRAVTRCCLCNELDPDVLFHFMEVLGCAKNIQIANCLGFFVTILSHLKAVTEKAGAEQAQLSSRLTTLHKATDIVCRSLYAYGDAHVLLPMLEGAIVSQLLQKPELENARSLLKVICSLDSEPTRLTEGSIIALGEFLSAYLLDVIYETPINASKTAKSEGALLSMELRLYYLRPCYLLFNRSSKLVSIVLKSMGSLADDSSRVNAILEVILTMQRNAYMHQVLLQFHPEIHSLLQKISDLENSEKNKMTLEERLMVQLALDQLRNL
ncbi:hypothetical protein SAY87_027358 [Trapa incisa]|uniref:TEX10-like TPR repeats domain-containing protein n=1 Tax=Trapa incisa TaxID=236973 RepID=A0AAN7H2A3_9MYRT|nr:hypothetical protein SAY87_027358 [Trapa incisa]